MDLIEAIHQGDQAAIQRLAANQDVLNNADAQGNTPLHYAVAQRDLESIEWLIKQGVPITAKNSQEETAADWFQEYIASTYTSKPAQLAELEEAIAESDAEFVADYLKGRVSRTLRFSRGETLLHIAVAAQQKAIIELLLEEISYEAIERILHLKNSHGLTPFALAQQHCQPGSRVAQEILNYLREKAHAAATGIATSAIQIPPPRSLSRLVTIEQRELKALAGSFNRSLTWADFEQLNPLRSTLVKLAYYTAFQALHHLLQLPHRVEPFGKPWLVIEKLLQRLFGVWNDKTRRNFEQKLYSIVDYLNHLIQQKQVEQVIQFSDKKSNAEGWCDHGEDKIFLNPTTTVSGVALMRTLLHEVTHQVGCSYDFFAPDYSIKKQGFYINLKCAYRLAANGEAKELTSEQRRLFEIRQLLEEGFSEHWKQHFYQWMALNSAETLAMAILALATVPVGAAEVISTSRRKPILKIHPQFLSGEAITTPFRSPEPNPAQFFQHSPRKEPLLPAGAIPPFKKLLRPGSSGSSSTCSGSRGAGSPEGKLASLATLKQELVSERSLEEAAGQLGAATTQQAMSSVLLIPARALPPPQ